MSDWNLGRVYPHQVAGSQAWTKQMEIQLKIEQTSFVHAFQMWKYQGMSEEKEMLISITQQHYQKKNIL